MRESHCKQNTIAEELYLSMNSFIAYQKTENDSSFYFLAKLQHSKLSALGGLDLMCGFI